MVQIQIHTRQQAAETVKLCRCASFSEEHGECSGLEGRQSAKNVLIYENVLP